MRSISTMRPDRGRFAGGRLLRFGVEGNATLQGVPYALVLVAAGPVWIAMLGLHRCYEPRLLGNGVTEFKQIFLASVRLVGYVAIVSYAAKLEVARGLVAYAFPLGLALLLLFRYGARKWLHHKRRGGGWSSRVLAIGNALQIENLADVVARERHAGYEVVGACLPGGSGDVAQRIGHVPVVGTLTTAVADARRLGADTIAVTASAGITPAALRRLAWELEGSGIGMVVAPALTDVAGPRIHITPVAGLPLLHVEEPEFTGVRRLFKSVSDRVLALLLYLLLSPVLLLIAVAVRVSSRGPALFRQERVGQDGQTFELLKFRSMYVDAEARLEALRESNEASGLLFKMRADPRVTPVGRWLRRYSLDELPQLWNVVRGDMALVGPRPPLPSEVSAYESHVRRRLLVRPGITGLWQVSGRSDLSWDDAVRLDLYYVENWSPALDAMILWKTLFAVVRGKGAC
jgi:exopolysaccharide biosynthesis polyprenyl glycosylphosphotransferase